MSSAKSRFPCCPVPVSQRGAKQQPWSCWNCSKDWGEMGFSILCCPLNCQQQMNLPLKGFFPLTPVAPFSLHKITHYPNPNVSFLPQLTFLWRKLLPWWTYFPSRGIAEKQHRGWKIALCIRHYDILAGLSMTLLPITQRSSYSSALGAPVNIWSVQSAVSQLNKDWLFHQSPYSLTPCCLEGFLSQQTLSLPHSFPPSLSDNASEPWFHC